MHKQGNNIIRGKLDQTWSCVNTNQVWIILPWHVGALPLHLSEDKQVLLVVPAREYPVSQEYVATPPVICEPIDTTPLVGLDKLGHRPTETCTVTDRIITR